MQSGKQQAIFDLRVVKRNSQCQTRSLACAVPCGLSIRTANRELPFWNSVKNHPIVLLTRPAAVAGPLPSSAC